MVREVKPMNGAVSMSSGTNSVVVENVRKSFGEVTALEGIDLEIHRGEFLSLLGPSGCGKSTLLRIIAGFEQADSGRVLVEQQDVTRLAPEKRPLNMVFQRYALFPHMNVEDNIGFGPKLRKVPARQIASRVNDLLELVQLPGYNKRLPAELSGGQAQRIALARALANDPAVLLLDEPLAALDRAVRRDLQDRLKLIQRDIGTTFVYVTHDQEEAMALSTRIVLMSEGNIRQIETPSDLYRSPRTSFAAGFVGDANLLACVVERTDDGLALVSPHGLIIRSCDLEGRSEGDEIRVMVRPEDIRVRKADSGRNHIMGNVVASTFFGFYWMHHIRCGADIIAVREISDQPSVSIDAPVTLEVSSERTVILPT